MIDHADGGRAIGQNNRLSQALSRAAIEDHRSLSHETGSMDEIERLAMLALHTRESDDLESEAIAEALLSDMEARAGRFANAKSKRDRALAIRRQLGNLDGEATVLNKAGMWARRGGIRRRRYRTSRIAYKSCV